MIKIFITISMTILFYLIFLLRPLFDYYSYKELKLQKQNKSLDRTLGFDHIYVINLDYRMDRRKRLDDIASYLGLDFKYFPAISKDDVQTLNRYGSADMNPSAKACYLSHYYIYKLMVAENYNSALILEDDADFELNITDIMTDIHRDLPASWEVLYVGHCFESVGEQVGKSSSVHRLYKSVSPMCLHAYAISYSAVHKLIELLDPVIPRGSVDYSLKVLIDEGKISSYSVHPQPIVQWKATDNPSDITNSIPLSFSLLNSTSRFLGYKQ
ncbi:putative inactive glycosyltransferase 25 family member 3 [Gigaspora margarita]|nr:putative inactive glycosyltransferase 25 family member 3 [Gigaspora margarita]